jgi:cell division septum initiation protein DivIVA
VTTYDEELDTAGAGAPDVEALLRKAADIVGNARPMPLSASVMVNRDEVLDLLEEAIERLPDEVRAARWLLKEREEFLVKVQREAEDILDAARLRAEGMVQRTEVVRSAHQTARRTVEEADAEGRRLRHEADDYCDHRLAQFEIVLDRTLKTVSAGRARLSAPALPFDELQPEPPPEVSPPPAFFDQDSSE